MPLGFQRLNEKQQRPSPNINFIKPLPGSDHDTAHDFLSRVAAISVPITRTNLINVMALEEFPPNREFWGRNFNNGECIQLVLKSPSTGRWLPFKFVQQVFMHELAHVHQMNHGREFWRLKNKYSEQLKELWGKGYVGEGLWGRGRNLYDGQIADDAGLPVADQEAVRQTCGGTFRGFRGRGKRRRNEKPKTTYAERQGKRVIKKFGVAGQALGDDAETRTTLEKGKKIKGKPRVAGSNRGRELRAAAALARFGPVKTEAESTPEAEEDGSDYETDYGSDFDESSAAKGADGQKLLDAEGNRLVKVCEGVDDDEDENARREMEELLGVAKASTSKSKAKPTPVIDLDEADISTASESELSPKVSTPATTVSPTTSEFKEKTREATAPSKASEPLVPFNKRPHKALGTKSTTSVVASKAVGAGVASCPVCSLENEAGALTCLACANVLRPDESQRHWKCTSDTCQESVYINAGDTARCGICGTTKV